MIPVASFRYLYVFLDIFVVPEQCIFTQSVTFKTQVAVFVNQVNYAYVYRQGYHFVLIFKICAYFQGQCLKKGKCAYF